MGDPFMCENPLDPVNSLDLTDIWCGPWLLKFLCVLFCGKSTKSAGVAKRQWHLVSNDRNGVETLRISPGPLKTLSERQVSYHLYICDGRRRSLLYDKKTAVQGEISPPVQQFYHHLILLFNCRSGLLVHILFQNIICRFFCAHHICLESFYT